jgi:hypothetical protein
MNTEVMRNTLHESEAGRFTFPQVVGALSGIGVESYFADLARTVDTFYLPTGETHTEKMTIPPLKIPEDFSQPGIVAAIRAVQSATQSSSAGPWRPESPHTGSLSPAGRSSTSDAKERFTSKSFPDRNPKHSQTRIQPMPQHVAIHRSDASWRGGRPRPPRRAALASPSLGNFDEELEARSVRASS